MGGGHNEFTHIMASPDGDGEGIKWNRSVQQCLAESFRSRNGLPLPQITGTTTLLPASLWQPDPSAP